MKIKTQFHLLIIGILIVPLLFIFLQFVYFHSLQQREQPEIAAYEEIVASLDPHMDIENPETLTRIMHGLSRIGNIAVFRKDFYVLYSAIPAYIPGMYATEEKIFDLITRNDQYYAYSFDTGLLNNQGYILMQREHISPQKFPFHPPLYPFIALIALFLFLILFAIIMSLLMVRSITRSVLILEDATRRIAEGELDLAVDIKGSNEITSLTNSLNKMRKALREEELRRSRFIMGVTHDLKTPLTLIKAYAEALEDGITEDPATHTGSLEIINAKADQLEGRINDLLDFVRMDSGEWRGRLERRDITAFLNTSAKAFALDAELFHHEFRFRISLPEQLFVPMDERLVLRALENLVNNAIRYTPDGSCISLSAELEENCIQLAIWDNGPGIDPADLPHIFELFYRGTPSRREQGMGLGLAVVKWVTDSHGWEIRAESEKGACFRIGIPLEGDPVQI